MKANLNKGNTSNEGGYHYIPCEVLRILEEEEALALRARPKVSACTIVICPKLFDKEVKFLIIMEQNGKDPYIKTKFPSGGMAYGEHPFAAAKREVRAETGYEIDDIHFACAAEISPNKEYSDASKADETHYKIFLIAYTHKEEDEPVSDGNDTIIDVMWLTYDQLIKKIPHGQRIGLQPVIDKLVVKNFQFCNALMNLKPAILQEGVYHTRKVKRFP